MTNATLKCGDHVVEGYRFDANVAQVAGALHARGVAAGDRVALLMRNSIEFLEITKGVGWLGAFPVPINWHLAPGEVLTILDDCEPKLIFVDEAIRSSIPQGYASEVVIVAPDGDDLPTRRDNEPDYGHWRDEAMPHTGAAQAAPGSIVYTSGTSGQPKGVQRQQPNALQEVQMGALRSELYRLNSETRALIPAPLYHSFPNQFAVHAAANAAFLETMPRFDAQEMLGIIEAERITTVILAPIMFVRLLRLPQHVRSAYDLSSLQWALHAGGPCGDDVKKAMIAWWGPIISEYYGGTETGPLTLCTSAEWLDRPGTCGRPLANVELRIVDAKRKAVPQGDPGEIFARLWTYPDFTFRNDPGQRAEVALGDLVTLGDVGYQDAEGYLYLCDRARDMVVSGGVNIYPAEVEKALISLDGVEDCAVFGVPDEEFGEAVVGFACGTNIDGNELRAALRGRIAGYKIPGKIIVVPTLPRDPSGKLRKSALRERYLTARAEANAGAEAAITGARS
jgi:long-chain acyl-CoA synthetase